MGFADRVAVFSADWQWWWQIGVFSFNPQKAASGLFMIVWESEWWVRIAGFINQKTLFFSFLPSSASISASMRKASVSSWTRIWRWTSSLRISASASSKPSRPPTRPVSLRSHDAFSHVSPTFLRWSVMLKVADLHPSVKNNAEVYNYVRLFSYFWACEKGATGFFERK